MNHRVPHAINASYRGNNARFRRTSVGRNTGVSSDRGPSRSWGFPNSELPRERRLPSARCRGPLVSLGRIEVPFKAISLGEWRLPSDRREVSVNPGAMSPEVSAYSTRGGRAGINPAFLSITREHNRVQSRGRAFPRSVLESFCGLQRFLRFV